MLKMNCITLLLKSSFSFWTHSHILDLRTSFQVSSIFETPENLVDSRHCCHLLCSWHKSALVYEAYCRAYCEENVKNSVHPIKECHVCGEPKEKIALSFWYQEQLYSHYCFSSWEPMSHAGNLHVGDPTLFTQVTTKLREHVCHFVLSTQRSLLYFLP